MTDDEFNAVARVLPGAGGRAHKAAYRVLVDGLTLGQASREVGVDISAVSRLCKRIRELHADGCPVCGAPLTT